MSFLPQERSRATLPLRYVQSEMSEAGATVEYAQVFDICDIVGPSLDEASTILAGVVSKVNAKLHSSGDWRHLINVPTVGYRIATPEEVRLEAFGRLDHINRQHHEILRSTEKVIRHPDITAAERVRAANAAANQGALMMIFKKESRRLKKAWPEEERSPVPVDLPEDTEPLPLD